jgi:hypothetical protein
MPKAILEFNLPEEKEEFEAAQKGSSYKCALEEIYECLLRKRLKYEADKYTNKEIKLLETLKDEYFDILNEVE